MSKARLLLLFVAMAVTAGLAASPAAACYINPVVCIGSNKACHPSPAQRLANERRSSRELTLARAAEARKRLAAGQVDVAAELAELLIPNIRPIEIQRSDCGVEGEIDHAAGEETEDSVFQAIVAGSSLAGSGADEFAGPLRRAMDNFSFGKACNTEFRRSFAAYLDRAVVPAQLNEASLFLIPRLHAGRALGGEYPRLVQFEGRGRKPPVRWEFADTWLSRQATAALKRMKWGRSITAAMDAFWAEHRDGLSKDPDVCPRAVAEWARVRQKLLEQMLGGHAVRLRRSGY